MGCCQFFIQNRNNKAFADFIRSHDCECSHCSDRNYLHKDCPYFWQCASMTGKEVRAYRDANVVVNDFGNERKEIILYRSPFRVMDKSVNITVDTSKRFAEIADFLVPRKPGADLDKYIEMMETDRKRATDIYYGFAMCNRWTHFFTFTVSPRLVENRYDTDNAQACWKYTRKAMQRFDPDVRILCVPERHENGALHFHALVGFSRKLYFKEYENVPYDESSCKVVKDRVVARGFCSFDKDGRLTSLLPKCRSKFFLAPYYEYGVRKVTKLGDPLWVTSWYPYGINSCAILQQDKDNMAAINYLVNYTNKSDTVGYGHKRYYRTRNLLYKDKAVLCVDSSSLYNDYLSRYGMTVYKDNDRMIVYRNFNVRSNDNEA